MSRLLLSTLFLLLCGSSLLYAGAKLVHAPAYETGDAIKTELSMEVALISTIFGEKIKTGGNYHVVIDQDVTDVATDKMSLDSRISRLKAEIRLSDEYIISADSRTPVAEPPANDAFGEEMEFFKLLSQLEWTTTLNADRQLTSVKYHDDFLHKIPTQFDDLVFPEQVILEANNAIARLPGKELAVGDRWNRMEEMAIGMGLTFRFEREFKYLGNEEHNGKQMAKIGFKTKSVKYEVFDVILAAQAKSGELKSDGSAGTLWYDIAAKQVVESNETLHAVGNLVMTANGQELPRDIDLTIKMSSKVTRE